jgi:hypothetical protein
MPLEFKRSWSDEAVESFRDSRIRFVESEMLPHDGEAGRRTRFSVRRQFRRNGAAPAAISATRRYYTRRWRGGP